MHHMQEQAGKQALSDQAILAQVSRSSSRGRM